MSASSIRRAESVLKIIVQRDGTGDFTTISEAVLAVPYECEAEIEIGPGIYREKLVCEKQNITLRGAGADQTRVVWGDGGKLPHPDGRPTHTFRSYTAFFSGENLTVEDLTIENDAGPGAQVGQAVAAYVDSARAVFRRVKLLGNQDTLFCAPLGWHPAGPVPSITTNARSRGTLISSLAGRMPCLSSAPSARWTTTSPTAMSRPPRGKPTGWDLSSGTAISSPTARRAASIWGGRGAPRAKRRCWTAVWEPTLRRRAFPPGTTARIRTWQPLPRRAATAPGQFLVPAGSMP